MDEKLLVHIHINIILFIEF